MSRWFTCTRWLPALVALFVSACGKGDCKENGECNADQICRVGKCVSRPPIVPGIENADSGVHPDAPAPDAPAPDATADAGVADTGDPDGATGDVGPTPDGGPAGDVGPRPDVGPGAVAIGEVVAQFSRSSSTANYAAFVRGAFYDELPPRDTAYTVLSGTRCFLRVRSPGTRAAITTQTLELTQLSPSFHGAATVSVPEVAPGRLESGPIFTPIFFNNMGAARLTLGVGAAMPAGGLARDVRDIPNPLSTLRSSGFPPTGLSLSSGSFSFTYQPVGTTGPTTLEIADAPRRVILRCTLSGDGQVNLSGNPTPFADFLAASPTLPLTMVLGFEVRREFAVPRIGGGTVATTFSLLSGERLPVRP